MSTNADQIRQSRQQEQECGEKIDFLLGQIDEANSTIEAQTHYINELEAERNKRVEQQDRGQQKYKNQQKTGQLIRQKRSSKVRRTMLTPDARQDIVNRMQAGESAGKLAKIYNVTAQYCYTLRSQVVHGYNDSD